MSNDFSPVISYDCYNHAANIHPSCILLVYFVVLFNGCAFAVARQETHNPCSAFNLFNSQFM